MRVIRIRILNVPIIRYVFVWYVVFVIVKRKTNPASIRTSIQVCGIRKRPKETDDHWWASVVLRLHIYQGLLLIRVHAAWRCGGQGSILFFCSTRGHIRLFIVFYYTFIGKYYVFFPVLFISFFFRCDRKLHITHIRPMFRVLLGVFMSRNMRKCWQKNRTCCVLPLSVDLVFGEHFQVLNSRILLW